MATVEVECLDKYIARLADRAYNVVGFLALVAAQVLNGMESLIEGRADEVCHACVYDGKLLVCGLFDIEYTCNQAATLPHDGPSQFEMELLVRSQIQMLAVGLEIVCKMGNRHFVRMLVVDAQSATHVDVLHRNVMTFQLGL